MTQNYWSVLQDECEDGLPLDLEDDHIVWAPSFSASYTPKHGRGRGVLRGKGKGDGATLLVGGRGQGPTRSSRSGNPSWPAIGSTTGDSSVLSSHSSLSAPTIRPSVPLSTDSSISFQTPFIPASSSLIPVSTSSSGFLSGHKVRFAELPEFVDVLISDGEDEVCGHEAMNGEGRVREQYYGILRAKSRRPHLLYTKLKLAVEATFADSSTKSIQALVDTGAEVNLINPRLVESHLFTPSPKPVRLGVANSHILLGGKRQVTMTLTMSAKEVDTGKLATLALPFTAYDAELVCDMILSYRWLAEHQVILNPGRHGLHLVQNDRLYWVSGIVPPSPGGAMTLERLPIVTVPLLDEVAPHALETTVQAVSNIWDGYEQRDSLLSYLRRLELQVIPLSCTVDPLDPPPFGADIPLILQEEDLQYLAQDLLPHMEVNYVKGFVHARDECAGVEVDELRKMVLQDYKTTVFCGRTTGDPPKRGLFGEAEIHLKPDAVPHSQRPYQMSGERRTAWVALTDQLLADGKIEPSRSAWCSPSFPVPKKKPGQYRLVVDFRRLNDATVVDSHPLPRIGDILQRQGRYRIWSVLDMKDGYHQIPLKQAHRDFTCMSTPRGNMRWKVLVMGLKNGNAIFQRVMEEVLRDLDFADPYVDDVIVGSTGNSEEELLQNHNRDLRKVLDTLQLAGLVADPGKAQLFVREVEFCGHLLREGRRYPSPGKLLPLQKWELPPTLTKLRGFLGLCNYYEEYVPGYSQLAWRLMEKLKVKGAKAKAGSQLPIQWSKEDVEAFETLKAALATSLSLHHIDPDQPYQMRTDASHTAVGAVLEQQKQGHWVPVCFFSRKLTPAQVNWSPREKEAYAIVASLIKWSGWVGTNPVTVVTDHKSLESWVREYVETPSGPTGRRARWHELFSQFNLSIEYQPGHTNIPADAMSRYAYPASVERQDVTMHGSETSARLVHDMADHEDMTARVLDGWISMVSSRASRENYRLLPHLRSQALHSLGVSDRDLVVDLFASKVNATCSLFITKRMDAFGFAWDKLLTSPEQLLWANPPFSHMDHVVTKIILEPVRMILVCPEWREQAWWKPLDMLTVARTFLPAGEGTYRGDCQHDTLPGPVWRTVINLVDSCKWTTKPYSPGHVAWVKEKSQGKGLNFLHTELANLLKGVMVSTRSGLDTEHFDASEEDLNDVGDSVHDGAPHPSLPSELSSLSPPPSAHSMVPVSVPETEHDPPLTTDESGFIPDSSPSTSKEQFYARYGYQHWPHRPRLPRHSGSRGGKSAQQAIPTVVPPPPPPETPPVMSESWDAHYHSSDAFSAMWQATQDVAEDWPAGVQIHEGRLYWQGKLCVPEGLASRTLWEFHVSSGHLGVSRMVSEVSHRFVLPDSIRLMGIVEGMRKGCVTCQATAIPHQPRHGPIEPFPIPERLMHSVCLDIFSMPPVSWENAEYDALLLCVDRLSGWIVACPTLKMGLTAERAAHLILDKGWEPFGVPVTVHSDNGPQFVGQWWRTLCARLGVQQTFSQPHRPRANGRAERAGQQLLSVLKIIHVEHHIPWIQALPRALRVYHDTAGPGGLSPYQTVFGRDRLVPGIPFLPQRDCEDARQFLDRMQEVDRIVARHLNDLHQRQACARNAGQQLRDFLDVGGLVWVLKPPELDSQSKLLPRWRGPFQITSRVGLHSYMVADRRGTEFAVHVDQLKPYTPLGEVGELAGLEGWDRVVDSVRGSRETADGELEYLVRWDDKTQQSSWVPHVVLLAMGWHSKVEEYHSRGRG